MKPNEVWHNFVSFSFFSFFFQNKLAYKKDQPIKMLGQENRRPKVNKKLRKQKNRKVNLVKYLTDSWLTSNFENNEVRVVM